MALNKSDVAKLVKRQRDITKKFLDSQYSNSKKAYAFYDNDINYYRDSIEFADDKGQKRRAMVNFGKIAENVDAVVGFMAQNRRQAKFAARVGADQDEDTYSDNMNALYEYHRENQNADILETEMDHDMVVCGYAASDTDLSYIVGSATTTPNGDILKRRLRTDQVGWDPKARGKNLLDARWAFYSDEYDLSDALSLFRGSDEEDFEPVPTDDSNSGYTYNPWGGVYDRIKKLDTVEWCSKDEDLVRVYNHQWFEYETFYKADNPVYLVDDPLDAQYLAARLQIIFDEQEDYGPEDIPVQDMFDFDPMGQIIYMDESVKRAITSELKGTIFEGLLRPIPFTRKVFYTAVYSGTHVFGCFKSISQQGFSIKFKTGQFNETHKIWVGMVNGMMEPQEYYNKALTELLFALAANSKGGVILEEDAVEDIEEFSEQYARTDGVAIVRSGSIAGGKIQPKAQASVPTGLETILTLADQTIANNGVPGAFMGNVEKEDQSGIFFKRRIRQVISKLAKYFDAITQYQKDDARLHVDLIKVWVENNNGEWIRITGDSTADEFLMQISEDMLVGEYDVSIQEAPQTPEDKQETASVLSQFGDKMGMMNPAAAMEFYAASVQMLPIDTSIKNKLMEVLRPNQDMIPAAQVQQQIQQMQAVIEQLQSQITQAEVAKTMSEVQLNQAKLATEQANAADKLEAAANKGLENDILRSGNFEPASVSI